MAGELILITGVSGFLGFRVLAFALESGYQVRGVIRRHAQADAIRAAPSVQPYLKSLDFVVVPDMLKEGAFDDVLESVTYILHCASPIPHASAPMTDHEVAFIQPAVKGTTGILKSALKIPSIKRIVITSSGVAIIPWKDFFVHGSPHIFTEKSTVFPGPTGPYSHYFEAYAASKVFALHATNDFIATQHPAFDVINIMPAFIIGANELTTSAASILDGTNGAAFAPVLGHRSDTPTPGTTVSVSDCAKVHVLALDPKIAGNQNFLTAGDGVEGIVWEDSMAIVKREFPEAVKKGVLPLGGKQPTKKVRLDASRTEEVFGIRFEGYETQVKSVAKHYLELVEAKV